MARSLPSAGAASPEAVALTKATARAAERLGINNKTLGLIIGLSEASVSRIRACSYTLQRGQQALELGVLLVRLYRSLDAIVGDDKVASAWLANYNVGLGDVPPIELIQTVPGLMNVIAYLDARRAVV